MDSFVTKPSADNYDLAINNAIPISTGEFNTDSESENIEVNNNFCINSPVVILCSIYSSVIYEWFC